MNSSCQHLSLLKIFSIDFKRVRLPHIAYVVIHELLNQKRSHINIIDDVAETLLISCNSSFFSICC